LTQEEYVQRVPELKHQGWSVTEIAREVGYHPATVSKWLKQGGPPEKRTVNSAERVIDARWAKRIDELIAPPSKLLAASVFEIIGTEGYPGSYPSVVRHVRARRGPRFRVAPRSRSDRDLAPAPAAHHARHPRWRGERTAVVMAPSGRQVAVGASARPKDVTPASASSDGSGSDMSQPGATMTLAQT
jgi:transcriptional regulator with XRE-family HTH domain